MRSRIELPVRTLTEGPRPRKGGIEVSLSVATAAERGRYALACCDGRLVFGDTTADVFAPKLQTLGDWVFTFAGELASTELVMEELRLLAMNKENAARFERPRIPETLVWAFNRRIEKWAAIRHVSVFGLSAEQFRDTGLKVLGEKMHAELARAMHNDALNHFREHVMVIGWGVSPFSLLIHSVGIGGDKSHGKDGHGSIGSGRHVATDTLLKFQHAPHTSLQDAIYMTAAAKFSAESKHVGPDTTVVIIRKRKESEDRLPIIPVPLAARGASLDSCEESCAIHRDES